MDTGTRGFPRSDIRVSDAERDQAIAELSEHFQAGRLTQDEFDDRSGHALKARTGGDLGGLFADLPPRRAVTPPQSAFPRADTEFTPAARRARTSCRWDGSSSPLSSRPSSPAACSAATITATAGIGWLVPVVILGFVFLRLARRR